MSVASPQKTIGVALAVCLVCSILVSTAAVSLSKIQKANKKADKLKNILSAGDLYSAGQDVEKVFEDKIVGEIIEVSTGKTIPEEEYTDKLNIETFDIKAMAKDPEYCINIANDRDIAQIKRIPKYMPIYKVTENEKIEKVILPIYGKGLWSTLYGFMALDKDLHTFKGFTFYEHGETPGLGGEVDNPRWKQLWQGKQAFDDQWEVRIKVLKGKVDPSSADAKYQIDGLSGSTITTRGIDNLVRFWLGEDGYGPLFQKLRKELLNE